MAVLACIVFASSDEWHQIFVPDRGGRWTDVRVDGSGVLLAIVLVRVWERLTRRIRL